MSERSGASGRADRNDRPGPWSLPFPSGPHRALPVFGRCFRSPYGPRPLLFFGPRVRAQSVSYLSCRCSEMASRKGFGVSYTWDSRTGWTLMAVTWHAGSLAVPVPPRVSPGQLAEVPGPGVGTGCESCPVLQQLQQTGHRSRCVRSLAEWSSEVQAAVPCPAGWEPFIDGDNEIKASKHCFVLFLFQSS